MLSLDSICERLEIPRVEDVDEVLITLKANAWDYSERGLFSREFLLSAFEQDQLLRHGIFCDPPLSRRVLDGLPEDHLFWVANQSLEFFVLGGYVVQKIKAVGNYYTHASAEIRKGAGAFFGEASGVVVNDAYGYGYDQSRVDARDRASVFLEEQSTGYFTGNVTAFCRDLATGHGLDYTNLYGFDDSRLVLRDNASAICRGRCFFVALQETSVFAQNKSFGITFGPKVNLVDKMPHWLVGVDKAPQCNSRPLNCPVVDWGWEPLRDLSKLRKQYSDNQELLQFLQEELPRKQSRQRQTKR